jgi:hypothetical protein
MFSFAYIVNTCLLYIFNYIKVLRYLSKLKEFSNYNYKQAKIKKVVRSPESG